MADITANAGQAGGLSPQSLRLEDVARILSALGPKPVTIAMLQADIDDGAPVNQDGTLNLLNFAAWLALEAQRESD